jgi:uncharacterized membrane protein
MMTVLRRLLIVLFVVFCSTRLTNFWGHYDNFPAPLRWLGLRFVFAFGQRTPEDMADLEQLFVFGAALVTVSLITWLVLLAMKRWRQRK